MKHFYRFFVPLCCFVSLMKSIRFYCVNLFFPPFHTWEGFWESDSYVKVIFCIFLKIIMAMSNKHLDLFSCLITGCENWLYWLELFSVTLSEWTKSLQIIRIRVVLRHKKRNRRIFEWTKSLPMLQAWLFLPVAAPTTILYLEGQFKTFLAVDFPSLRCYVLWFSR